MNRERIEFDVYDKYDHVANIIVDEEGKVHVTYYNVNMLNNPLPMENPAIMDVATYLESRCFPDTRANAYEILRAMDLYNHIPSNIVKKTYGLMHSDYIWLKFKGDNTTYDDIKIRD